MASPSSEQHLLRNITALLEENREYQSVAGTSSAPLVLVTGGLVLSQTGRWPLYGADAPSMDLLRQVGALPLGIGGTSLAEGDSLDLFTNEQAFRAAFETIYAYALELPVRGLYLPGGGDAWPGPGTLGQGPQPEDPQLWQDVWEYVLLLLSLLFAWPTLGVCRGMQHMNVAAGGGLVQDLRAQWRSLWAPYRLEMARLPLLKHRARGRRFRRMTLWRTVCCSIRRATWLACCATLLAERKAPAHSNASSRCTTRRSESSCPMARPSGKRTPGLRVAAVAPDGVIEAFEWAGKRPGTRSTPRSGSGFSGAPSGA